MHDDDDVRATPPTVVGAVALGTAPLPFLAVYSVLFLIHGSIHPVNPPDVTTTKGGEFVAGWIALAVFILTTVSLLWFVNGRRRWLFALAQLGVLGTAIDFLIDDTKGGQFISVLIVLTSVAALALGFAPQGWDHVGRRTPRAVQLGYGWRPGSRGPRRVGPATTPLAQSSEPTAVEPATLRRRRTGGSPKQSDEDLGARSR